MFNGSDLWPACLLETDEKLLNCFKSFFVSRPSEDGLPEALAIHPVTLNELCLKHYKQYLVCQIALVWFFGSSVWFFLEGLPEGLPKAKGLLEGLLEGLREGLLEGLRQLT